MNEIVGEWIEKAEKDWASANWELQAPAGPNYDAVCFHAQQCAEKYLKARLTSAGIRFPRTHDLRELLDLVLPVEPTWEDLREGLEAVSRWAVEVRYPGLFATPHMAQRAVETAGRVRSAARKAFGLQAQE